MNEDYVSFEQAKALKELGFDWECYQFYNADKKLCSYTSIGCGDDCRDWNDNDYASIGDAECSAPTLAQAQKWLRIKNISICVEEKIEENITRSLFSDECHTTFSRLGYYCRVSINQKPDGVITNSKIGANKLTEYFDTYEEALSRAIDYYLKKLLENNIEKEI